jgi:hypothetical protein
MSRFKTCSGCETSWETRDEFIYDESMAITGYQPAASSEVLGYVLFTHDEPGCGSTLAVESEDLLDLHDGPTTDRVLYGSDECRGHCYRIEDISECDAPCRNALVREVIKKIIEERKRRRRARSVG